MQVTFLTFLAKRFAFVFAVNNNLAVFSGNANSF
jgi:hypothetical protein